MGEVRLKRRPSNGPRDRTAPASRIAPSTAAAQSDAGFRTLFDENGSVFLIVESLTGNIIEANRAASAFYGYTREQLLAMSITQINTLGQDVLEVHRLHVRRGEANHINYRHRLASGDIRDVEVYSSPIQLEGRILHFSVIHDVTERKRAQLALEESGGFLNEAQKIGDLGFYVLEIASGVWSSSEVLDAIFGIDSQFDRSIAGWVSLIYPADREMMDAYFLNEVLGERKSFEKEYRIVRPSDNALRWMQGIGNLECDSLGHPLKMRGIIKDITERKEAESRLLESEERFRATFEQAGIGMIHTALDGKFLRSNTRFAEMIGYLPEEIPSLTFQQITSPEDRTSSVDLLQKMVTGELNEASWEKRYIRKDGARTWVKLTISALRDSEGRLQHFIALVEDINAIKAAERRLSKAQGALRVSEARYHTVFETTLDAISINRVIDDVYIDVNKAFCDISGYSRDDVVGRTPSEIGIWADLREKDKAADIVRRTGECRNLEGQFRRKNGDLVWGLLSASLIEIDGAPCLLAVTRDITNAKVAEDEIKNLAFFDPLTGLPNRRMLMERLRLALAATARSVRMRALLIVDLDNFKALNDTLGHQTGDILLCEVAGRLGACLRQADTVARVGGDEFVVILEDLSEAPEVAAHEAEAAGQKILSAISRPYLIEGHECLSAASIGITVFGDRREGINEVMKQADIAMYQAKAAGRNKVRFFSPALQAAVHARANLEDDLRQGIKSNQFQLYYQPQVDRGCLIGAEALIRWMHPQRGMLMPDDFIPVAEDSGLILPLGEWVLNEACHQAATWARSKRTAGITVAVNISALQLHQPDFVKTVLSALQSSGASPRQLNLELTESMLVENFEEVNCKMSELKSHGLRFSLDDFGTGYSSLSYLKRLPLDHLKIDRSFVRDLLVDASSGAIAQTIISLSHAMGLSVIAEGVETEGQRDFLARMGCYAFQGYLLSRPVPVTAFELLLDGLLQTQAIYDPA